MTKKRREKQLELLKIKVQKNTEKNAGKKTKKTRYPCKVPCKQCGTPTLIFQKQKNPRFPLCGVCLEGKNE